MTAIREPILAAGFPLGSSLGLVMAFEWLGQPYRLTRVDMLGEMRSDAYLRLNGRQETPVLITDEGPLTETMAIALWLEARDDQRRISFAAGTRQADQLHQCIAFLNTGFTGAFAPLWVALEAEDAPDDYRNSLRQLGRMAVAKRHGQLEAMIGDSDYLLGDKPTLADAVFRRCRALGGLSQGDRSCELSACPRAQGEAGGGSRFPFCARDRGR